MIKLIATDLDGTLATHDGKIPEKTFEVIKKIKEKGIHFVVATGRQTASVENDFKEVLNDIYVIAENGGVVRKNREDKYITYIDYEKTMKIIEVLEKIPDIYFLVCCKERAYQNTKDPLFDQELDKYYHERAYLEDLKCVKEPIVKIAIYHPVDIRKDVEELVRKNWEKDFKVTVSGKHWVDIGSLKTNKGEALKKLQKDLGIKSSESMAFGDYFNDVEMFENVAFSYAMSHAIKEVKAFAKYEAPTGKVLNIIEEVCSS